jgi:hypothetical protein
MPVFLKVEQIHTQHPDLMVREHKRAVVAGHYAGGRLWAEQLLPEHFEKGARSEFGYFKRKEKYMSKKIRLARLGRVEDGGRQDLVFTGLTRRMARLARNLVSATPREVKVAIPTPRHVSIKPNRYAGGSLGREIIAISPRHEKLVTAATGRGFDREHHAIKAAKRTVFRS